MRTIQQWDRGNRTLRLRLSLELDTDSPATPCLWGRRGLGTRLTTNIGLPSTSASVALVLGSCEGARERPAGFDPGGEYMGWGTPGSWWPPVGFLGSGGI